MTSLPRPLVALAAVLALAVAGVTAAVLLDGGDRPGQGTAEETAPPLGEIESAWTAGVERGAFAEPVVVQAGEMLVVSTEQGLFAYAKDCGAEGATCDPLWTGRISVPEPAPTVSGDVVFEATERRLYAFDVRCGSGGATCEPLWTGEVPIEANSAFEPVTSEGVVKVNYSFGEGRQHEVHALAFPTRCGSGEPCEPLWTAMAGKGTAYFPAPAVGGSFFQQVGTNLVGFRARCGTGGAVCRPSFLWPIGGETVAGMVEGKGELLVTSNQGSLYALPLECPELPCRPLWRAANDGYIATPPVVFSDTAFVSAGPNVHAYRLGCREDGGACAPEWTATVEDAELLGVAHADRQVVIAVSLSGPGFIWAFPSKCVQPCRPLWTAATGGKLGRVEVVGGRVFVGTHDGDLLLYPIGCAADGSECSAARSWRVPGRISELFVDNSGIYVLSWGGEDRTWKQGTLTAFRE